MQVFIILLNLSIIIGLGTSRKSLNKNKEVWTSDGRPQVYMKNNTSDIKL